MRKKDFLIIIPAYNEEKNIPYVLEQLEQSEIIHKADVLVIDDASSDDTGLIVKKHQHLLIRNIFNMGYGCALQVGYKYAVHNNYQYVIQMDADGQHDICNIPKIYSRLVENDENGKYPDVVLASRFMEGSSYTSVSVFRKLAYAVFGHIIKAATGVKISDPTTGLQGLSRRAFSYYSKYNHFDDKYPDTNMIIQAIMLGFHVVEIPSVMHARKEGQSMHDGLKPLWYMIRMSFSIVTVIFRMKVLKLDVEAETNI